jgi:Mg2+-importing ATPase
MLSVLVASVFLPFLPMLPIQILVLNLIYDISCITMPWDNVDSDYLLKPRRWEAGSISRFMLWFGPISSIFDIASFALLFWIVCPILAATQAGFESMFQTGWFIVSIWTQTLVIHMLRTEKLSFIKSNAAWQVTFLTSAGVFFGSIIPWTRFGARLDMLPISLSFLPHLLGIVIIYMLLTTLVKYIFVRKYKELL